MLDEKDTNCHDFQVINFTETKVVMKVSLQMISGMDMEYRSFQMEK